MMATAPRKVEIRYASLSWWKEMREPTAEEGELFTQKMKLESGAITNAHHLVVDHRWWHGTTGLFSPLRYPVFHSCFMALIVSDTQRVR